MKPIEIKIFKAGTHTSSDGTVVSYSENDLKQIVEKYNNQPKAMEHNAPIIGGDHSKIGKKALGFITKLIQKGADLFAEILPTPELVDDVRNNRYKHVSIGLNAKGELDHLAVLGAVKPAVKGLGMLSFSEEEIKQIIEFKIDKKQIINYSELNMNPQLQAFREALQKFIIEGFGGDIATAIMAEFDKQIKENGLAQAPQQAPAQQPQAPQGFGTSPMQQQIANQYGQQFSESEEGRKMIDDLVKVHKKINDLEFSAYLEKNTTKLLPANLEIAKEIMQSLAEKETNFSENGSKLDGVSLFKKFISNLPQAIETSEFARKDLAYSQEEKSDMDFIKSFIGGK